MGDVFAKNRCDYVVSMLGTPDRWTLLCGSPQNHSLAVPRVKGIHICDGCTVSMLGKSVYLQRSLGHAHAAPLKLVSFNSCIACVSAQGSKGVYSHTLE